MSRERLDDNLRMLRKMEEHLSAMLAKVKADPELQGSSELIHVTGELIKSLGAEIRAVERAIGEIGKSQAQRGPEGNPEGPERT